MIINKFAFGNKNESFIEDRFENKLNIIYSNDNNKGKTLIMQGIMYAIGNEPIFPSEFDYGDYYFYLNTNINGMEFTFIRKRNSIIVKTPHLSKVCSTISDFKYFINKHIFSLPKIEKNHALGIVDPSLFYELFFVSQDKRNTSDIISKGRYNKKDFINMLYFIENIEPLGSLEHDIHKIKEELKKHESEYSSLKRKLSILKSNPEVLDFLQKSKDNEEVQKKEKQLLKLHKAISDFKRKRTREVNRKNKLITLLTELRSLNNHMEIGNITCSTCGSDKIIYRAENFEFDVSNQYVRKSIIDSINEDIELKSEIIIELTNNINKQQDLIDKELKSTPTDIKNILIFKDEVISVSSLDTEAHKLLKKIKSSKDQIKNKDSNTKLAKIKMDELENTLVDNMNSYYQEINSDGNLRFGSLFTKKDQTYSGSEEQEFYFCKVMSIKDHFNLPFPILVDSFRDGELSSAKEDKMLDILQSTSGQIILTSTLKSEEYSTRKYESKPNFNANIIDYSLHTTSKILSNKNNDEFHELISDYISL